MHKFLDFLFPSPCVLCLKSAGKNRFVCPSCEKHLTFLSTEHTCRICRSPVLSGSDLCGRCLSQTPVYDRLVACTDYDGAIRTALHHLKFYDRPDLAESFAGMACAYLHSLGETDFQVVVPVPLSKERLFVRGFNQSHRIADGIAKHFGVPCVPDALVRKRNTPQQSSLHMREREKNVRGAFSVTDAIALQEKRVLLVDDIFTTGATMRAAAGAMSGIAASVVACVIGRTSMRKS